VEQEIRQAQAETLGRTGERLQAILARLAALDCRVNALLDEAAWATGARPLADLARSEIESRNRLRDEAVRLRHHLIIQREALGLVRQTLVEQCYPVPGRRHAPGLPDGRGRKP
jgi:hypothetical protein